MALVLKDRVQETTTTTGTGVITLDGAATGFQAFSAVGNSNQTYYTITDGTNWETGIGTVGELNSSPALSLNFTSTTTLDSRISLTRATNGTYFDSNGVLQSASSGVARFDHRLENGVWVNKGLLVEPARTNIAQYSEQFNNAFWTKSQTTATANAIAAPDGTTTADRINETAVDAGHNVSKTFTGLSINTNYSWSAFVKGGLNRNYLLIQYSAGNNFIATVVDITRGQIAYSVAGTTDTLVSTFFMDCGGGWYRVGISGSLSNFNAVNPNFRVQTVLDNFDSSFLGATNSGFYIWGAQLETGAGVSSYIETPTNADVTRNADALVMTGTNFSDWYNQSEGTFLTQAYVYGGRSQRFLAATDNTSAEQITGVVATSAGQGPYFQVIDGSVTQTAIGVLAYDFANTIDTPTSTVAFAFKQNDFAISINGDSVITDGSGTLPTPDRMFVGSDGSNYLNGILSSIYFWSTRLTDGEVQYLAGRAITSTGRKLFRDTVLASTNSNALVNWSAGTKTVFSPLPAQATLGSAATADDSSIGTNQYAWANFKKALDQGVVGGVAYSNENTNGIVSTYSLVSTSTAINHVGGVLAPNGDVHFIPYNNVRGQKLSAAGVVSTYSLVYTVANAYGGGVLAGNGDIHFVPTQAARGQKVSASGVVSTYSLVYTTNTAYFGGVLAPNGDIHFVPTQAARGQKVSAAGVVSTYSLVYTTGTGGGYLGGCLAPNGDIHFIPRNAPVGQKISAAGVVSTYSLVYTTSDAYRGGVLSPNGDIHFIPFNAAVGQKISAAGVVSTYSLAFLVLGAYNSGVLAPNGDIHFIPASSPIGQKISVDGVVSTYNLLYTIASGFGGGILRPDGSIVFIPQTAVRGQIISTNPGSPLGLEECLSSYLNKF
jgi:hypothetical protein